ncbi:hypothetical protein AKJ08_2348 [Vulgatibacter incomptus]|uniref:Uncharacterized protein n=1 Tax=Vulgatibacter incomptus TaxID=1391653 RepID=A0A0K1PEW8_9BACT|nr:hypothetical protein AKJ08_2348 [Vulgatibacter incomptus]
MPARAFHQVRAHVPQHLAQGRVGIRAPRGATGDVEPGDRLAGDLHAPTVQSRRFLNAPGSAPAYSGVQKRSASASAMAARSSLTAPGRGSRSASGLNGGSRASPWKARTDTGSGASSAAVRTTAVLVEPDLVLPLIARILMLLPNRPVSVASFASGRESSRSHRASSRILCES